MTHKIALELDDITYRALKMRYRSDEMIHNHILRLIESNTKGFKRLNEESYARALVSEILVTKRFIMIKREKYFLVKDFSEIFSSRIASKYSPEKVSAILARIGLIQRKRQAKTGLSMVLLDEATVWRWEKFLNNTYVSNLDSNTEETKG